MASHATIKRPAGPRSSPTVRLAVLLLYPLLLHGSLPAWAQSSVPLSTANPLHLTANHVTASVEHLEQEAAWYERVFGFKRSELQGGRTDFGLYQMTLPGYRIDLVWEAGSARHSQNQGRLEQGWLHIVFNTPDLDAAWKYLVAQKTDVKMDRDVEGRLVHLTLHDPEGNEIGLVRG